MPCTQVFSLTLYPSVHHRCAVFVAYTILLYRALRLNNCTAIDDWYGYRVKNAVSLSRVIVSNVFNGPETVLQFQCWNSNLIILVFYFSTITHVAKFAYVPRAALANSTLQSLLQFESNTRLHQKCYKL